MSDWQEGGVFQAPRSGWYIASISNGMALFKFADCQDEPPPMAQTPEEADEILDRWQHG